MYSLWPAGVRNVTGCVVGSSPVGTTAVILPSDQEDTLATCIPTWTTPLPCAAPKFCPTITNCVPAGPVSGVTPLTTGLSLAGGLLLPQPAISPANMARAANIATVNSSLFLITNPLLTLVDTAGFPGRSIWSRSLSRPARRRFRRLIAPALSP